MQKQILTSDSWSLLSTFVSLKNTQGDSGDATDDEMVSRKTRSCKEGLLRNGPESDSVDQDDPGEILFKRLISGKAK